MMIVERASSVAKKRNASPKTASVLKLAPKAVLAKVNANPTLTVQDVATTASFVTTNTVHKKPAKPPNPVPIKVNAHVKELVASPRPKKTATNFVCRTASVQLTRQRALAKLLPIPTALKVKPVPNVVDAPHKKVNVSWYAKKTPARRTLIAKVVEADWSAAKRASALPLALVVNQPKMVEINDNSSLSFTTQAFRIG